MAPEEGFTIRDRRREAAEAEPVRPPGAESSPQGDKPGSKARPTKAAPPGPLEMPPEPDLAALFLMLADSALLHLGEAPGAMTGAVPVDLAQAKFSIDLLKVLKEKTEGNLSQEESRLLDGILYDLQMRFVRAIGSR